MACDFRLNFDRAEAAPNGHGFLAQCVCNVSGEGQEVPGCLAGMVPKFGVEGVRRRHGLSIACRLVLRIPWLERPLLDALML